jgi:tRNA dimethylallyltransferase
MKHSRVLITGVTGSGKSRLAFELASWLGSEIISVDSMKVYRGMDIGTAKPSSQARQQVPYHLIDVVEPWDSFSVERFLELTGLACDDIEARGKKVIAAGGTAMYIKALLWGLFEGPGGDEQLRSRLKKEYEQQGPEVIHGRLAEVDPEAAERIHPNDRKRIVRAMEVYELTGRPISSFQEQFEGEPDDRWLVIGIRRSKEEESRRINARVKRMVDAGLVDEVKRLLEMGRPLSKQAEVAIGYAEIIGHLQGKWGLDEAIEKIKINSRRLAKSQRTWFKRFGNINWIDASGDDIISETLDRAIGIIESN